MRSYAEIQDELRAKPRTWLVTGVAGFIGSHLAQTLLGLGQRVTGLDDMSTGRQENLDVLNYANFDFIQGSICDAKTCSHAATGADIILHHAAIASVVKSLEDPALVRRVNEDGFLNILNAAKNSGARVVYASSSAIYGDSSDEPRHENEKPAPQSPYAETKLANEHAAAKSGIDTIGLRYFNIYGARQDPNGTYAAVIPKWLQILRDGGRPEIYGDGKTIRDFCHIDDAAQANILAATTDNLKALDTVYNVGSGAKTSLNELYGLLAEFTGSDAKPVYKDFRAADIRISQADIAKTKKFLGFKPLITLPSGLRKLVHT